MFKKQFTTYHAVNSFFSYIFSQVEFSSLNNISFCKTSGRLNYNESKLTELLKNKLLKSKVQTGRNVDYDAIEREEIHSLTS